MSTPELLERRFTLLTAVTRYDELRTREALGPVPDAAHQPSGDPAELPEPAAMPALTSQEALELLALGELIARKATYGRQLSVRTARAGGASWSQIGAALGTSKQSAWEAHARWIDDQAEQYRRSGFEGLDAERAAASRAPNRDRLSGGNCRLRTSARLTSVAASAGAPVTWRNSAQCRAPSTIRASSSDKSAGNRSSTSR